MSKIKILMGGAIVLISASAIAQSRAPMPCPPGATCRNNSAIGTGQNTTSSGVPNTTEPQASDREEQEILKAVRQLNLDSDQRSQLDLSLKAQKEETATLDKALKESRSALGRL